LQRTNTRKSLYISLHLVCLGVLVFCNSLLTAFTVFHPHASRVELSATLLSATLGEGNESVSTQLAETISQPLDIRVREIGTGSSATTTHTFDDQVWRVPVPSEALAGKPMEILHVCY
jgi:predicted transcriptional regulator